MKHIVYLYYMNVVGIQCVYIDGVNNLRLKHLPTRHPCCIHNTLKDISANAGRNMKESQEKRPKQGVEECPKYSPRSSGSEVFSSGSGALKHMPLELELQNHKSQFFEPTIKRFVSHIYVFWKQRMLFTS